MNSDLFYAIVKLVSGEEILAQVCSFIENDEVLIVMDNPVLVQFLVNPRTSSPLIKVLPWIHLSNETTYIIRRKDVMIMTEVKDPSIVKIHKKYINDLNHDSRNESKSSTVGYVNNIHDARKSLEKLYQSDEAASSFE